MYRRPPRSTRTDTLLPDTTRGRSRRERGVRGVQDELDLSRADHLHGVDRLECGQHHGALNALGSFEVGLDGLGVEGGAVIEGHVVTEREGDLLAVLGNRPRSEEHTSELQSLMRISYAVFCLKKKTKRQ